MVGEVLAGGVGGTGASEGEGGASKDGGIKGTEGQEKEGGKETGGGEGEAAIGGCGLIIDYGGAKAYADSLRVSISSVHRVLLKPATTTREAG